MNEKNDQNTPYNVLADKGPSIELTAFQLLEASRITVDFLDRFHIAPFALDKLTVRIFETADKNKVSLSFVREPE